MQSIQADLAAARRLIAFSKFNKWLDEEQNAALENLVHRFSTRIAGDADFNKAELAETAAAIELANTALQNAPSLPKATRLLPASTAPANTASQNFVTPLPVAPQSIAREVTIAASLSEPPQISVAPRSKLPQSPIHPLDQVEAATVAKPIRPPVQQRLTADLLKSFMEQSNIRWVELVSASLIVVCSVGLVISLWSTLSSTSRFFPSLVFLLATVAVHGAGQYTLRQWRLRTTSRGILHIGLMLIPLAMLVGILLSKRGGDLPTLNLFTGGVIAIGTAVYGALAITASRSLFASRWLVVALLTIVSSLTLLPIYYLSQHGLLNRPASTWALLPLGAASLHAAFFTSQWSIRTLNLARLSIRTARLRLIAGSVTQSLFCVLVVIVFWIVQSKQLSTLNEWWFVAAGIIAAGWISWGWSASLTPNKTRLENRVRAASHVGSSWLVVAGWMIASACSLLLVTAVWQVAFTRIALVTLLLAISAWWLLHGWRFNLRFSVIASALAATVALSLSAEGAWLGTVQLQATDWLSFERITTLTGVGLATAIATMAWGMRLPAHSSEVAGPARLLSGISRASLSSLLEQVQLAGGIVIVAAALLTMIASVVPLGSTPYGGNWAALMLVTYGVLIMAAGIVQGKDPRPDSAQTASRAGQLTRGNRQNLLLPFGQVILLFGTVRLCQTSPMLDEWLVDLRPSSSWAIGTTVLAMGWTILAAVLRIQDRTERQRTNVDMLCGFSMLLSIPSAIVLWIREDHLSLATAWGWFLPVTCFAIFLSWRRSGWREFSLYSLCLWLGSVLYATGHANSWWSEMGLAHSCAAFVLLIVGVSVIFEFAIGFGYRKLSAKDGELGTDQSPAEWIISELHFASQSLCHISWLALCLALLGPAFVNILACVNSSLPEISRSFINQPLNGVGFALVLTTIAAVTAACIWLGRVQKQVMLLGSTSVLPIAVALAIAAFSSPPYSLVAALWALAALLIASELYQFAGTKAQSTSQASWQQLLASSNKFSKNDYWLLIGRAFSLGIIILGTAAMIAAMLAKSLPSELGPLSDTWLGNLSPMFILLGPAALVSMVRWSLSLWNAESPRMISASALATAMVCAAIAALALVSDPPWYTRTIVLFQSFGLISAVLAWKALSFNWLRNFLGLRAMLGGKVPTRQLISKSMKGARWQRSENAAWSLNIAAMVVVAILCTAAAAQVVYFPVRPLPDIERLGGFAVVGTSVVALALLWFLSSRRGDSKFGLLALSLGLVAPLGAAAYTAWLVADASRPSLEANGFEPIRALLTLWLTSLAIGLVVRFGAMRRGRAMRHIGEIAWILLAVLVASISIVSTTQDPGFYWPLFELSTLALITVLSGVVAQQTWRGHLAAIAAAVGLSGWLLHRGVGADVVHGLWVVLWGPTWIAFVALGAQFLLQRWRPPTNCENMDLAATPQRRSAWFAVDTSVVLTVPIVGMALSAFWILVQKSVVRAPTPFTWWILGLSAAVLGLSVSRLWKRETSKRGLGVYLSLISVAVISAMSLCSLGELPKEQTWLLWLASGLGALAVMAGLLRELVREASVLGPQLQLGTVTSPEKFRHALSWMPAVHSLVALAALIPSILLVLALEDRSLRIAATLLPFLGGLSILPVAIDRGRVYFRYCGLALVSTSTVLLWWADLPNAWTVVDIEGSWIFLQRAFVGLIALGIVYPILAHLLRRKTDWVQPLMHLGWVTLFLGIAAGGGMLLGEFAKEWDQVAATASLGTKLLTLAAWTAIVARLLQFAVRPHSSDTTASDSVRKLAVFAAEAGISMLCAACYFHFPNLFRGILVDWWPIVVFAIALLSAGLGEWMQRVKQPIIGDPILQSSLLLPMIPLAGVWLIQPESAQWLWNDWGKYAVLLLSASALYGLHGWIRNSIPLRALAGMFGLCAFWAFLHSHPDLGFFQHPQFWLLPPSVAALSFAEINRRRLDASVVTATRYIAVLVAYLSSSSEVFLKAFEGQLWQPILLLALALAGVGAGIILRVRAFLFCGVTFTFVALLGMVWHAQQAIGQVWPWWAFGIVTGICLIVFLGYFEKNRPQVVAYLEQFKRWEQ
jgi:hypothetical protein